MRGGVMTDHQPRLQTIMGLWYILIVLIDKFDIFWYFGLLLEQVECFMINVHNYWTNSTTQGITFSSLTIILHECRLLRIK